jgi:hypothetical protein
LSDPAKVPEFDRILKAARAEWNLTRHDGFEPAAGRQVTRVVEPNAAPVGPVATPALAETERHRLAGDDQTLVSLKRARWRALLTEAAQGTAALPAPGTTQPPGG